MIAAQVSGYAVMMSRAARFRRRELRRDRDNRWFWVVAALLIVLGAAMAGNANTYALHAGMAATEGHGPAFSIGQMGSTLQDAPVGDAHLGSADDSAGTAHATQGQHLLHLVGACLALLAFGLALLLIWLRVASHRGIVTAIRQADPFRVARSWQWRGPPALTPPTTSPVLRT